MMSGKAAAPRTASVRAIVTHARTVPSLDRETFAQALDALGEGPGHVVVHTCHRVELYVAPSSFNHTLPAVPAGALVLEDADAASHLIAVACGMDSAVFGETQILHQLRETIGDRGQNRALDAVLDRLFAAALHAGRTAHAWFSGTPRSLADVALDRIGQDAGSLAGRRILVVGTGRMGRLAAFAAQRRGARVSVTNRSPARATGLALEVGGATIPFGIDGVLSGDADASPVGVIVAISGRWPVGDVDLRTLVERQVPVVDLSSPPAIPPSLQLGLRERFVGVDDLFDDDAGIDQRLRHRLDRLISETGREYCHWIRTRDAVPAIQAVVATAEQHRRAELDWLNRRLSGLRADDLNAIEQMSHRLVAAILHAPLSALNGDQSGDLEKAARELFGV